MREPRPIGRVAREKGFRVGSCHLVDAPDLVPAAAAQGRATGGELLGVRTAFRLDHEEAADHVLGFGLRPVAGQRLGLAGAQMPAAVVGEFLA